MKASSVRTTEDGSRVGERRGLGPEAVVAAELSLPHLRGTACLLPLLYNYHGDLLAPYVCQSFLTFVPLLVLVAAPLSHKYLSVDRLCQVRPAIQNSSQEN